MSQFGSFIRNNKGQTLTSALISIAITSVMTLVIMTMTQNMNKSMHEFQKSVGRTFYETALSGYLKQSNFCSCNLSGRAFPVGATTNIDRLTSNISVCPVPNTVNSDLYRFDPVDGHKIESGLVVSSINVTNVISTGGDSYSADFNIIYDTSSGMKLKNRTFKLFFDRDIINPASTAASPILSSCSLDSPPTVIGNAGSYTTLNQNCIGICDYTNTSTKPVFIIAKGGDSNSCNGNVQNSYHLQANIGGQVIAQSVDNSPTGFKSANISFFLPPGQAVNMRSRPWYCGGATTGRFNYSVFSFD